MIYKKIFLDDNDKNVYLEVFAAEKAGDYVRRAILILPGGAYSSIASEREGEPIALAFMPYGYNAFVLHYSVNKEPFPIQLIQASKAVKHIRDNAKEYNIDAEKVFVVGFSAGGHLAATLGTMWDKKEIYDYIEMEYGYNKPTGMMLIYPVISSKYHMGSFKNLLMEEQPSSEMLEMVNIENHINKNSSPAYIIHTSNDTAVNVKNSLVLADKMATLGIQFELHIYPDAPHGVALGNDITKCGVEKWSNQAIAKWIENAVEWAKSIK